MTNYLSERCTDCYELLDDCLCDDDEFVLVDWYPCGCCMCCGCTCDFDEDIDEQR